MLCRRRVGPIVDSSHSPAYAGRAHLRGKFRCRNFADRLGCRFYFPMEPVMRPASPPHRVNQIQVLMVCSCKPMHQYEVHGFAHVCMLISRSEAHIESFQCRGRQKLMSYRCAFAFSRAQILQVLQLLNPSRSCMHPTLASPVITGAFLVGCTSWNRALSIHLVKL